MVGRPRPFRPAQDPFVVANGMFVGGGEPAFDQPCIVKLNLLASIKAEPGAAVIVKLGSMTSAKPPITLGPEFDNDSKIDLPAQLALDEGANLLATPEEVHAIAPLTIDGAAEQQRFQVAIIPSIFGIADVPLHRGAG